MMAYQLWVLGLITSCLLHLHALPLNHRQKREYANPSHVNQRLDYFDMTHDPYEAIINELAKAELLDKLYKGSYSNYYGFNPGLLLPDLKVVKNWPVEPLGAGQIAGVAVAPNDDVFVLHRGSRVWDKEHTLFDVNNIFTRQAEGPITEETVIILSPSGHVLARTGANRFYLPHGISTDRAGNIWITDVAMHQVFKFSEGEEEPSLTLGKAFEPASNNSDQTRFCKPTDVAVASNGDFFVADGYCNQRVVKFNKDGDYLGHFGQADLSLPHSLTLAENFDMICVADRENSRVACYDAGLRDPKLLGDRVGQVPIGTDQRLFAIAFSPKQRLLYGVTEADERSKSRGTGFTIDLTEGASAETVEEWSPDNKGFDEAHDLAIGAGGNTVYVVTLNPGNIYRFEREEQRMQQPLEWRPGSSRDPLQENYDWWPQQDDGLHEAAMEELVLEQALWDAYVAAAEEEAPIETRDESSLKMAPKPAEAGEKAGMNEAESENIDDNDDNINEAKLEDLVEASVGKQQPDVEEDVSHFVIKKEKDEKQEKTKGKRSTNVISSHEQDGKMNAELKHILM